MWSGIPSEWSDPNQPWIWSQPGARARRRAKRAAESGRGSVTFYLFDGSSATAQPTGNHDQWGLVLRWFAARPGVWN